MLGMTSDALLPPSEVRLSAGDIVLFYDFETPPEGSEPGPNQIAVVVDERGAFFRRRNRILRISYESILELPALVIRKSPHTHVASEIEAFFSNAIERPVLFQAGLAFLFHGNLQPFISGRIFPARPRHDSPEQYELAWLELRSKLRPMDAIFTRSFRNPMSNLIAWATHGPWSHVAVHVGDGEIAELTVPRMRRGPIELYKGRNNWVALYRHIEGEIPAERAHEIADAVFGNFRDGYNYRDALRHLT